MKILIIAGHGAGDVGASATIHGVQFHEATQTRVVAQLLVSQLSKWADVTLYNTGRNAFADHKKGVLNSIAQFQKYDYVLEIHFNAAVQDYDGDGKTTGVECFVTTGEQGTKVENLMVSKLASLGLKNRGVKRKNFSVISQAKKAGTSAALLEICFIDDADDMKIYNKNTKTVAKLIAEAIREGFGVEEKELTVAQAREIVQKSTGLSDDTIAFLECYKYADALLIKLADAM